MTLQAAPETIRADRLPFKPGDLIRHALADLEKCEADPRYHVDFGFWHVPMIRGTCSVCWVGSVMAQSLGADPRVSKRPEDFPERGKLHALDMFRLGKVVEGAHCMGAKPPREFWPDVPAYDKVDAFAFKGAMLALAHDFDQ